MSFAASTLCVADTGVLLELHRLGYLEMLRRLFERVLIPPAVLLELQSLTAPTWMNLTKPSQVVLAAISTETNLGRGELEALAVAMEQNAWVLLDDKKARHYARSKEISSIGTLGLLILIHQNGWQQRSAQADLELLSQGLWITKTLLEAALQQMTSIGEPGL